MEQSISREAKVPHLVMKFSAFHETRKFIAALTTVHYLPLSWARSIQSNAPCRFLEYLFLYYYSKFLQDLKWSFLFRFLHHNPECTFPPLPAHLIIFIWSLLQYMVKSTDHEVPRYSQSSEHELQ